MIKDFLISFKDNFKEKTHNPFLGTYLIVWFIRNWDLIYTLFNFDKEHDLEYRINFIRSYYSNNDFIGNLLINILWALGVLILSYLLLNASRFIINLSEKQITPWIYKITDSKSIVLKEQYDGLKLEKNHIETKLENERESKVKLLNEVARLENRIDELLLNNSEKNRPISTSEKSNSKDNVDIYLEKLKEKNYTREFIDFALQTEKSSPWIPKNNEPAHLTYFFKIGLLEVTKSDQVDVIYNLTESGKKVFAILRLQES